MWRIIVATGKLLPGLYHVWSKLAVSWSILSLPRNFILEWGVLPVQWCGVTNCKAPGVPTAALRYLKSMSWTDIITEPHASSCIGREAKTGVNEFLKLSCFFYFCRENHLSLLVICINGVQMLLINLPARGRYKALQTGGASLDITEYRNTNEIDMVR